MKIDMKVDVGRLTSDECAELLPEIMDALTDEVLFRILAERLTPAQADELNEIVIRGKG